MERVMSAWPSLRTTILLIMNGLYPATISRDYVNEWFSDHDDLDRSIVMHNLEKDGYITSKKVTIARRDRRAEYFITDAGRALAREWLDTDNSALKLLLGWKCIEEIEQKRIEDKPCFDIPEDWAIRKPEVICK